MEREKAIVQGAQSLKSSIENAKTDMEAAHRTGDLARFQKFSMA